MVHFSLSTNDTRLLTTSTTARVEKAPQPLSEIVSELKRSVDTGEETLLDSDSNFTIVRAPNDPYELYQDSPELMEKAKALAERLDGPIHEGNANHFFYQGGMRDLLRVGVLTDPDFLDMASSLDDEELDNLMQTLQGMVLPASHNITSHTEADRTLTEKVAQFVDVLKQSSPEERGQILSQAATYAGQVDQAHLKTFSSVVYGQDIARFNALQRFSDNFSANNLHNYVSAIIDSDDPVALTEQLSGMSDQGQQGLLTVYGLDTDLGQRLSTLISAGDGQIPDNLIASLGDMVDAIRESPFAQEDFGFAYTGDEAMLKDNEQSSGRDFALDSVSSMIEMMENYDFSDEQLETMGTELSSLSNPEKRAYIEITATGLDAMLQAPVSENLHKKNLDEAVDVVSTLRTNQHVLDLVNRTRYHDVTLVERPDIEEGLTVVALEGAAVFQDQATAFSQSRLLLGATENKVNMVNGHSVKGHESENLYSAKKFDAYKKDVGNLVNTLVAFESMRQSSTANDKTSLNAFSRELTDMHSGIRDELVQRVSDEIAGDDFRSKVTENTQFAFFSSVMQQMRFDVIREFKSANWDS